MKIDNLDFVETVRRMGPDEIRGQRRLSFPFDASSNKTRSITPQGPPEEQSAGQPAERRFLALRAGIGGFWPPVSPGAGPKSSTRGLQADSKPRRQTPRASACPGSP